MDLNIEPIHYKGNDCFDDQLASVVNWLGLDYVSSLKDCWNFEFKYKNNIDNNTILGDKISGGYNPYDQLLNNFGIKISDSKVKSVYEELDLIRNELNKGLPVLHVMNAYQCPWDERFDETKDNSEDIHALLIVGIDDDDKTLTCTDGWYNKRSEKLSVERFIKGYTSHCYTFNIEKSEHNPINLKDIILNTAYKLKTQINNMRMFGNQVAKALDMNLETASGKTHINNSYLYNGLTHIILGRIKYSVFLEENNSNYFIEKLSKELKDSIMKWEVIRALFVKASFVNDISKIKLKIASKIHELSDYEERIADNILQNIEYDWNFTHSNEVIDSNKNNISIPKISEVIFVDLIQYFNNNGIGSLSNIDNVKLLSTGEYLLSKDLPSEVIEIENMKFKFPEICDELNDNICCNEQNIAIDKGKYSCIMFLGCSENGHFTDNFQVIYSDGEVENVQVGFTEFKTATPMFDEKIVWQSKVERTDNPYITTYGNIFGKSYKLNKDKEVIGLKLPYCLNIHIFSISLGL